MDQAIATRVLAPVFRAVAVLTAAALVIGPTNAQSIFAESNFSEAQHSALIEPISLEETDLRDSFSGFRLYLAAVRVADVYYGPLKENEEIEIQINAWMIGLDGQLEIMSEPFILSFCESPDGTYYTNDNFVILPANEANIAEFERLRAKGTDFDGKHDCHSTNFDLGPIAVEPEVNGD